MKQFRFPVPSTGSEQSKQSITKTQVTLVTVALGSGGIGRGMINWSLYHTTTMAVAEKGKRFHLLFSCKMYLVNWAFFKSTCTVTCLGLCSLVFSFLPVAGLQSNILLYEWKEKKNRLNGVKMLPCQRCRDLPLLQYPFHSSLVQDYCGIHITNSKQHTSFMLLS